MVMKLLGVETSEAHLRSSKVKCLFWNFINWLKFGHFCWKYLSEQGHRENGHKYQVDTQRTDRNRKKTVAKSLTTDFQILQPKNAITENNRKKITENIKSVEELYRLWILAMLQPKRFSKNSLNRERPNLFFALWPILMAHNLGYGISWPWTNTE